MRCGKKPTEQSVSDQGRPDVTKSSKPSAKIEAQIEAEKKAFAETKGKAEAGNIEAQNNLGIMYINGEGVLQDYVTSYAWANIAGANGCDVKRFKSEYLEKKMTPEQIAEAEALAKKMIKKNPKLLNK